MLRSFTLFFLFGSFFAHGQSFSNNWTAHFSYNNVKEIFVDDENVFAASENAFFIYNKSTGEITKKSTVDGLSGENVTAMYFSKATNRVVLGYDNGMLDIYDLSTERTTKVVDIFEKQTIPANTKIINDITEINGLIYISTNFGISLYNLERLEFDDTYFIGPNGSQVQVRQTILFDDGFLYAATNQGIFRALATNENLIDFNNWSQFRTGSWLGIQGFLGDLYYINSRTLFRANPTGNSALRTFPVNITNFVAKPNRLLIATVNTGYVLDETITEVASVASFGAYPSFNLNAINLDADSRTLYLGTTQFGMLVTSVANTSQAEAILPAGPLLNNAFAIKALPNTLWIVFGDYTGSYNPFPLDSRGISKLTPNGWLNIPFEQVLGTQTLVHINANPQNPNNIFISSFYSGILELVDDVPTVLYNNTNSTLESLNNNNPAAPDIRIGSSVFDEQGNLWAVNSRVENVVKVRRSGGNWQQFSITDILPNPVRELGFKEIVIDQSGNKFFSTFFSGVVAFREAGNRLEFKQINEGEARGNLPNPDVRALAVDNDNQLWIGTALGLRVLFNPSAVFNEEQPRTEPIIIEEDGLGSELLFEQFINDIFVDGANNKWVGTSESGAFYFSEDGSETIFHFTKDNSPLPSNSINQIEVDPATGIVYFATPRGMVSFQGNIIVPPSENLSNVYAYPNPVRPGFTGNVTVAGLVNRANVKITDIEGNLVFETTSTSGTVEWDLTAFGRHKVASGVYLVLISSEDGTQTKVTKIMVVR